MGSESIDHSAFGLMGYWLWAHSGSRNAHSVRSFQCFNFLSQVIYSFLNNPDQIIDERTLGHVHLQGKRFFTVFLHAFYILTENKSTLLMLVCGSFKDGIKCKNTEGYEQSVIKLFEMLPFSKRKYKPK